MGMDTKQQLACREVLDAVLGAKDGRRALATMFRALPPKAVYPDYYAAIPEPQCLDEIKAKLDKGQYPSAAEMLRCLHLVFLNAKHYNEDGSAIFQDAQTLEGIMLREWTAKAASGMLPPIPGAKRQRQAAQPQPSPPPEPPVAVVTSAFAPRGRKRKTESQPPQPQPVAAPPAAVQALPPPAPTPAKEPTPPPQPKPISPYSTLPTQPAQPPPPLTGKEAQVQAEDAKAIAELERTLEKWSGPQEAVGGWFGQGMPAGASYPSQSWPGRISGVIRALVEYRDLGGKKLSETLYQVGEASNLPYLTYTHPLSLSMLQERAQKANFASLVDFDMEMTRLFEKARRWFMPGSIEYGHVLTLQRMYSALTCSHPPLPSASGTVPPSPTAFAGLPAGPGNAKSFHETNQQMKAGAAPEEVGLGVTTFRVGTRGRIFLDEARWKGVAYRLGDYVHLANPDDPTRPTVGQIFRTYIPDKAPGRLFATICWYYRPEQTVHPAHRLFFENEIYKTGHFADHPIEDILERVTCQFFTKYVRGRPHAPEYYPGWPLYICNSRFNDKDNVTVKIKNWGSCIPEELRKSNFMAVIPFPNGLLLTPRTVTSPFLRGAQGPGCTGYIGDVMNSEGDEDDDGSVPPTPRVNEPSKPRDRQAEKMRRQMREGPLMSSPVTVPSVPQQTASPMATQTPSLYIPNIVQPQATPFLNRQPSQQRPTTPLALPATGRTKVDRSIAGLVGGAHNLAQMAVKDALPEGTVRMLERDYVDNQVLWFSAPPAAPGSLHIPDHPTHSLEYLSFLAKRKLALEDDAANKRPCRFSVAEAIADDADEVARMAQLMQTFLDEEPVSGEMPRSEAEKTPEEMATALRDLVDSLV